MPSVKDQIYHSKPGLRVRGGRLTVTVGKKYVNLSAVSRQLDVSVAQLSRIFSGSRTPSLSLSLKLVRVLGISLDKLLYEIGNNSRINKHLNAVESEEVTELAPVGDE